MGFFLLTFLGDFLSLSLSHSACVAFYYGADLRKEHSSAGDFQTTEFQLSWNFFSSIHSCCMYAMPCPLLSLSLCSLSSESFSEVLFSNLFFSLSLC